MILHSKAEGLSAPCAESAPSGGPGQSPGSAQPTDLQRLDLAIAQLDAVQALLAEGHTATAQHELDNVRRELARLRSGPRALPHRVCNAIAATREHLATRPAKNVFQQKLAKARMVLDLSIVRVEDLHRLNLDQAQAFAVAIADLFELQRNGGAA